MQSALKNSGWDELMKKPDVKCYCASMNYSSTVSGDIALSVNGIPFKASYKADLDTGEICIQSKDLDNLDVRQMFREYEDPYIDLTYVYKQIEEYIKQQITHELSLKKEQTE